MRKLMFLFGILALVTGCSSGVEGTTLDTGHRGIRVTDGDSTVSVIPVVLDDGTTCAVLVGFRKGAISCNWTQQ